MIDTGPLSIVHLTDEQARRFILFNKHYDLIDALDKAGALNLRNGNLKLHFNGEGEIKIVDKQECIRI